MSFSKPCVRLIVISEIRVSDNSIFSFDNASDYLHHLKHHFGGRKRKLSYNQLAKVLGYSSPRTVAMAWEGQRPLSKPLLEKIRLKAQLSPKQYVYLELLASVDKNKKLLIDSAPQMQELKMLSKKYKSRRVDERIFSLISKTEHILLHQMLQGKRSVAIGDLKDKIRKPISKVEIEKAIENLLALKLLTYDQETGRFQEVSENLMVGQDVPSKAIQKYHQEMLDLAEKALTEQLVSDRDFNCHTFRFDRQRLTEAKDFISQFIEEFNERFQSPDSDDVYQLNLQLFSQTKPGSSPALPKDNK